MQAQAGNTTLLVRTLERERFGDYILFTICWILSCLLYRIIPCPICICIYWSLPASRLLKIRGPSNDRYLFASSLSSFLSRKVKTIKYFPSDGWSYTTKGNIFYVLSNPGWKKAYLSLYNIKSLLNIITYYFKCRKVS